MPSPHVWRVMPALSITPKKTFFGLDKGSAHCFTIDQRLHPFIEDPEMGGRWGISKYNKQVRIRFYIFGKIFPAELRLSVQDRSKTRIHSPGDLPSRTVYQFQWPKFEDTIAAIKTAFPDAYLEVKSGNNKHDHRIVFHHLGDDVFMPIPSSVDEEYNSTLIQRHEV